MRFLLPAGIKVATRRRRSRTYMFVFLGCVALAALLAVVFGWARDEYFDGLHVRFIGGLDSSVVIFLLGLVILLYVASATFEHRKPAAGPRLTVAFLIPAHNEGRSRSATASVRSTPPPRAAGRAAGSTWWTTPRWTRPPRWPGRRSPSAAPSRARC